MEAVCCRCHRILCRDHDGVVNSVDLRRSLRRWGRPPVTLAGVESRDGPDPPPVEMSVDVAPRTHRLSARHFCRDCMPLIRLIDAETSAASITLGLGVIAAFADVVIGGILIAIGGFRIAKRALLSRGRRVASNEPPTLLLDPRIRKLRMVEKLSGTAHLDADHVYRTKIIDVHGSISVEAAWGRADWALVTDHRRRHHVPPQDDLWFSSGSLVVRGPARLTLQPSNSGEIRDLTRVVLLRRARQHVVLHQPGGHGDGRWPIEVGYDITPPDDGWTMPVWLTPTIVPESDRRALHLEVQWRGFGPADDGLEMKAIELLRISVPADWGEIEDVTAADTVTVSVPGAVGPGGEARRWIEWQKPLSDRTSRGGCRLFLRFEGQIKESEGVSGRLEVRFNGAVSGAEGVDMYSAGGVRRHDGTWRKPTTLVELNFDLSLAAVRYQDVRAVPNRRRPEDLAKPESERFDGVVPDHHTVARLTNNLSSEGYYVKRVVENPPQPGKDVGAFNRFWDIAGRLYTGVYPIDFHLTLAGEEIHDGQVTTGYTTATINVHGTYATPEMEEKVVREWGDLWTRIRASPNPDIAASDSSARVADGPIDASSEELARLRNVAVTLRAQLELGAEDGDVSPAFANDMISRIDDEFSLSGPAEQI